MVTTLRHAWGKNGKVITLSEYPKEMILYLIIHKKETPVSFSNYPKQLDKTEGIPQLRNYLKDAT